MATALLSSCLLSNSGTAGRDALAGSGVLEQVPTRILTLQGSGTELALAVSTPPVLWHSQADVQGYSNMSAYTTLVRRCLSVGVEGELALQGYIVFETTDTLTAVPGFPSAPFWPADASRDTTSLQLQLFLDSTFYAERSAERVLPAVGSRLDFEIGWGVVTSVGLSVDVAASGKRQLDSLRGSNTSWEAVADSLVAHPEGRLAVSGTVFADTVEIDTTAWDTVVTEGVSARVPVLGHTVLRNVVITLPNEVRQRIFSLRDRRQFLMVSVGSDAEPAIRFGSAFDISSKTHDRRPVLAWTGVGRAGIPADSVALRRAIRSGHQGLLPENRGLTLWSGIGDSLAFAVPWTRVRELLRLQGQPTEVLVRARLRLVPQAGSFASEEADAISPLAVRTTIDSALLGRAYSFEEFPTGIFGDSGSVPQNWVSSALDTVELEINDGARILVDQGDSAAVTLRAALGSAIKDPSTNKVWQNQYTRPTFNRLDLGDPSQLRWSLELQMATWRQETN